MCDPLVNPLVIHDVNHAVEISMHQHREVMEKVQELVNAVHGIHGGIITALYLGLVAYFFYLGKITDWVWIFMTLAGMTQYLGEKIVHSVLGVTRPKII